MEDLVASMTIRNIDDALKQRLRVRAATHGRSMEDEARDILRVALAASERPARNLAETIRARLTPVGGVDLDIPAREAIRDAPEFGR
jgi:plasmid stability protein